MNRILGILQDSRDGNERRRALSPVQTWGLQVHSTGMPANQAVENIRARD